METIIIGTKKILVFKDTETLSNDVQLINNVYSFNRKNAYAIGLKSRDKLISILKENGLYAQSFMKQPSEPSFTNYSMNDFEDRELYRNAVANYPKEKTEWESYPKDFIICI